MPALPSPASTRPLFPSRVPNAERRWEPPAQEQGGRWALRGRGPCQHRGQGLGGAYPGAGQTGSNVSGDLVSQLALLPGLLRLFILALTTVICYLRDYRKVTASGESVQGNCLLKAAIAAPERGLLPWVIGAVSERFHSHWGPPRTPGDS